MLPPCPILAGQPCMGRGGVAEERPAIVPASRRGMLEAAMQARGFSRHGGRVQAPDAGSLPQLSRDRCQRLATGEDRLEVVERAKPHSVARLYGRAGGVRS